MAIINVTEAKLKTLSVEIKSLTINGRQMTLSTFRQLTLEPIFSYENIDLAGVPWGRVNYYFDDCKKFTPPQHLHVVWQKGDELRRACVEEYSGLGVSERHDIDDLTTFLLLEQVYAGAIPDDESRDYLNGKYSGLYQLQYGKGTPVMGGWELQRSKLEEVRKKVSDVGEYMAKVLGIEIDEMVRKPNEAVEALRHRYATRKLKYADLFDLLKELPQLFIAT